MILVLAALVKNIKNVMEYSLNSRFFSITDLTLYFLGCIPENMKIVNNLDNFFSLPDKERKFWYIPEEISTSYKICESNEPFTSIKDLFLNAGVSILLNPVFDEYDGDMFLRKGAAERLLNAALRLKDIDKNLVIKVYDAFRPLRLQRKFFEEIKEDIAKKEGLSGKELWERTTQFIADPSLTPPHSTGGAIDCTISYLNGDELDMGTKVDSIDDRSNTWSEEITQKQKENRMLLYEIMMNSGFVNLTTEWWHYSYGDQYWAIFNKKDCAIYGSKEDLTA